jgi:gamma-glutamyltranspeptidase/glutathione hydrolase
MLAVLEENGFRGVKPGSVAEVELFARAGAVAFATRNAYLADPDANPDLDMTALLAPDSLRGRIEAARRLRPGGKARPGPAPSRANAASVSTGRGPAHEGEHTTHFSVVDAEGNVVSCSTTLEHGMGSGLVVPGRGFLLNNELTDFDLDDATGPNALGATRYPRRTALGAADTVGGKRPRSSMTPILVFKEGRPWLTAGSPGGARITGIVAQLLVNVIDHGMDVQEAINAPRTGSLNGPLALEALYPNREQLVRELRQRGWKVERLQRFYEAWGGAQAIRLLPGGPLEGGADPRREGAVRGY